MCCALGLKRAVVLGAALCVVSGLLVLGGTPSYGSTTSTSYYVDNGATCPGSGTQASPWCNLSVVNSTVFQPGDQILLKRGDTFTTGMILSGSGTSTNWITVGSYGSGASPIIEGDSAPGSIGINLYNDSYVQVEGLAIEDVGVGILINDVTNQTGFRFLDLYLSGDGDGIQSPSGTNAGAVSNVLVQDVEAAVNQLSCTFQYCEGAAVLLGNASDVIVNRLDAFSNCGTTNWGLGSGASNVLVENSESIGDGSCYTLGGATANYLDGDTNVTFVNDIIADVPYAGSVDLSAIDVEPNRAPDTGINIEDDYIAQNAGPGIEVLDQPYPITNVHITGNVLSDNGASYSPNSYPVFGQIWTDRWLPGTFEATGSIANNFYNAPAGTGGFEQIHAGANFNGFTQSNNIDTSGTNNLWYAANGFSCTAQGANGWSYQSSTDNSIWTNLSGCTWMNPLDQEWSNGGAGTGFVSNFEELPPSTATSWVARSWTAPTTGVVSTRGRVLMTDPTCSAGATAEITENTSPIPIWGPQVIAAGDDVGVDANLDGLNVHAGDVLHFAVQQSGAGQCRVSWTPSVGIANPVSVVVDPLNGAQVTGSQVLDASAFDSASPISSVQYLLTGGSLNDAVIATATPTLYGWVAVWQSASVLSGTYTLQSMARDAAGNVVYSPGVTINVNNVPVTSVLIPSGGSSVSGSQVLLDASASDPAGVSKVEFELTGGSLNGAVIATGTPTYYGELARWNSTLVPNGTYTLQSVAYDAAGNRGVSSRVTIVVQNPLPTTSVLIPSNGASVSGSHVLLDASASGSSAVSSVEFRLTGGSLNDALIATATPTYYGWIASWDSTSVPDGTYMLQSVADDSGGNQGIGPAISVTVAN